VLSRVGAALASLGMIAPHAEYWKYYLEYRTGYSSGVRCGQSPDASSPDASQCTNTATKHTAGHGQRGDLEAPGAPCVCLLACVHVGRTGDVRADEVPARARRLSA
jgi:hypothetical protein